jgi:pimeloyl-ACP methyl ester carboxylesterase
VLNGRYRTQRLTVPTLVLFGKDDVAISTRLLDGLDEFADDARIEFVDHAGHFIAEEQPELVAQRLMEFLGDVNSH